MKKVITVTVNNKGLVEAQIPVAATQVPDVAVQGNLEAAQASVAAKNKGRRNGTDAEVLMPDSHSKLYGYIRVSWTSSPERISTGRRIRIS